MLSDNDDFLFPSGIIESLKYLERSPDYASAGGGTGHFETRAGENQFPNLAGKIERLWYQQSRAYQSYDLDQSLASARVLDVYARSLTVHYNTYRLAVLRRIAAELTKHNFKRLESSELFWKLRLATLGKLKSDASYISYLRQIGTSSNPSRGKDFIDTLSNEEYIVETQAIVKSIASIAAESDGISQQPILKELDRLSAKHLRSKLIQILGWRNATKLWFKKYLPESALRRSRFVGDRIRSGKSSAAGGRPISREGVFTLTAEAGAAKELVEAQRKELLEIEVTLKGREFRSFVQCHAPDLLLQK
jgi:hypothetical protein